MRNLTLKGNIAVFKTLAIFKIKRVSLITNVQTEIINKPNKIKEFK